MTTICRGLCLIEYKTFPVCGKNTKNLPKCRRCYVRFESDRRNCPCCGTPLSRRTVYKPQINYVK